MANLPSAPQLRVAGRLSAFFGPHCIGRLAFVVKPHQAQLFECQHPVKPVDLKDIKAIVDLMKKNSVSEFEMEKQDFKIRLKRGGNGGTIVNVDEAPLISYSAPTAASPGSNPGAAPAPAKAASNEVEISSPMIGTFYRAPSPESAAYVEVGTEVDPETVVCIIEAMKVMNEIKAEAKGVVTEVLVDNAKPVEFGQALFKIRPA